MKNLIISASAIFLFAFLLYTCSKTNNNTAAHPLFSIGDEVKFKASRLGKKAVIVSVDTVDKQNIVYVVSYFTLWDTRRIKRVNEVELKK